MPPNPSISALSCGLSSGVIAPDARHRRGDGIAQAEGERTERGSGQGGDRHRSRSIVKRDRDQCQSCARPNRAGVNRTGIHSEAFPSPDLRSPRFLPTTPRRICQQESSAYRRETVGHCHFWRRCSYPLQVQPVVKSNTSRRDPFVVCLFVR